MQALWPESSTEPAIFAPATHSERSWSRDDALVEVLRGRLEGLGPVTPDALAAALGLKADEIATPLAALQAEGFAMRGRFTPGTNAEEWCERRLLARIHHYTVKRLRAEIEPVAARDFLRFLLGWQRVTPDARMQGPKAVDTVIGQLEGFEARPVPGKPKSCRRGSPATSAMARCAIPGGACRMGPAAAAQCPRQRRRGPRDAGAHDADHAVGAPSRRAVGTLSRRRMTRISVRVRRPSPTHLANRRVILRRARGRAGLLRSQLEEGAGRAGRRRFVSSDSFGGLRALLVPSGERRPIASGRRRRRTVKFGMEAAGRWALARRPRKLETPAQAKAFEQEAVEHVARALLRRYGVVFWRLLEREATWLPPWRDLLRVFRRLESRGEIRGGRFVAGFTGEQFALPDAVGMLREVRRQPDAGALISLSGADPLNLVGILTPGPRLAALSGNRLLYRDGLPIAVLAAGDVQFLETLDAATEWQAHKALLRAGPAPPIAPDVASHGGKAAADARDRMGRLN